MNTYKIYSASTGELLGKYELDATEIENLSSDNDEGHFRADCAGGLESLGERTVYAILC